MNSLSILKDRKVGLFAVAAALLLAVILPVIASAAQLTERSIALSSSSKEAEGVLYEVKFTSASGAAGAIIDFCEETPVIGEACSTPAGFTAAGADNGGTIDSLDANTLEITQAIVAEEETTIELEDITNPDATGAFYARIVTYDTTGNLATYVDAETLGSGVVDEGGASIIITDTIGVSGAVLESMTFCVSGSEIEDDCVGVTAPTIKLGQTQGDVVALAPGVLSENSIYSQITTNSASGAVVSLKSDTADCGGLVRAGAANCDIAAAGAGTVAGGDAKFGVKAIPVVGGTGFLQAVQGSVYEGGLFSMNYVIGNTAGVTSTYGDPFLDTNGVPAANKNVQLTFAASINNQTPAGLYSADLSLIATGKF
ncbi:MAG: hypothetical protein V4611_01645 [Patescibacteria group bacterium]